MIKAKHLVILIITLFVLIRLFGLNSAIYDDEANFAFSVSNMDEFGFNPHYYSPILLNLIYIPFIALLGLKTWVFRLVPYLFGILNIGLVYLFAKRNYSKKVAQWSALLMVICFYPTLAALQFDVEGNLIMSLVLFMLVAYKEYERSRKYCWQILAGLCLGAAVVNKYNLIYSVFILGAYSLVIAKFNFRKTFKDLLPIYLTGFCVFMFYILLAMIDSPNWWQFVSIAGSQRYLTSGFSLMPIAMFLLWSTPLLFGFYFLSIKNIKKHMLLIIWITVPILFYTLISPFGAFDKYFMSTIPAMAILGGYHISKLKFTKLQIHICLLMTILFTILLFLINSMKLKYVARIPSYYVQELMSLNFNFLFSYTSSSGPLFGISFVTILLTFIVSAFCVGILILSRNPKFCKVLLAIFIVVGVSFNLLLISEYIFHTQGPDPSKATYEMIDYFKESGLQYPVYSNDEAILFYLNNSYWLSNHPAFSGNVFGLPDNELDSDVEEILAKVKIEGGTILLLNWPPIPEQSPVWDVLELCNSKRAFYSKNYRIGEVYIC